MSIGDTDFGVQVGIGVVGRVITAVVAFLGSILLARVLGPTGYGTFYLLMAVVALLDNPVTGWAIACRKRLTETDFPSGEALGSTIIGIGVGSALVFAGAWVAAGPIARFTGYAYGWLLLSVLFVGMVTYRTVNEVLKSTEHFGASTWLEASRDTLRVIGQAVLVLAGFGVSGMVGGMVVATLLVAPIALYLIGIRPQLPSRETLRGLWSYARFSVPLGVVNTAQTRMDLILIGFLVSAEVAGSYEVAYKLTIPAMFVAGVAQNGLMGRISNLRSRGEPVVGDVENNLAYASVLGIPLFFGAAALAGPIVVTIYSSQYAAAAPFLVGLALFRLLRTQRAILKSTLDGLDRPDLNLRIALFVFPFNLVLGLALLFAIGPIGVVVATVVSEFVGYSSRAYLVRSLIPSVTLFPRPLLEQLVCGGLMAILVFAARAALPLGSWYVVAFIVGLGGVAYFVALVGISHSFRSTILAIASDAGIR